MIGRKKNKTPAPEGNVNHVPKSLLGPFLHCQPAAFNLP
jgi:hypothetical protein